MIFDKYTKFILSVIAIFLCLNTLSPWISPTLVNAEVSKLQMSLQQTLDEISRSNPEDVRKLNSMAFHRLAKDLQKNIQYQIDEYEKSLFDDADKKILISVISIDNALKQLVAIETKRFQLQKEYDYYRG